MYFISIVATLLETSNDMCSGADGVTVVSRRLTVQLPPAALADVRAALLRHLRRRLGRFDVDLDGIVLDYKNVKIVSDHGMVKHDSADVQLDIQADFHTFRPEVGAKLRGVVNKKCVTHLSVLAHKIFNVVLPRPVETSVKWSGDDLEVGQNVLFTIVTVDLFGALPYIRGQLDDQSINDQFLNEESSFEKTLTKITPTRVDFDGTKPRTSISSASGITTLNGISDNKEKFITTIDNDKDESITSVDIDKNKSLTPKYNCKKKSLMPIDNNEEKSISIDSKKKSITPKDKKKKKSITPIDNGKESLTITDSGKKKSSKKAIKDDNSDSASSNKSNKKPVAKKRKRESSSDSDSSSSDDIDIRAKQKDIMDRIMKMRKYR